MMNSLEEKFNNVSVAVEKYTQLVENFNAVKRFMQARVDNIDLTKVQAQMLERYQYIYNQLVSGKYSEKEVRFQLTKPPYNMKMETAYADIRNAKILFGTTFNINKMFLLKLDLDRIEIQMRKAVETNNLDAFAKLQKARTELIKLIPDEEPAVPEDYVPTIIVPQFDPKLLGIENLDADKVNDLKKVLLDKYKYTGDLDFIEDIKAEVITNEESETN